MRVIRPARVAARAGLHLAVASAVALALGWALPRSPAVGTVVALLGAALLGIRLAQQLRSRGVAAALGSLGVTVVLGLATAGIVAAVLDAAPGTRSAAMAATTVADPVGDCGGCGGDVSGIAVDVTADGGTRLEVAWEGPPPPTVWIWRADTPGAPMELAPTGEGRWQLTTPAVWDLDPLAVQVMAEEGRLILDLPTVTPAVAVSTDGDRAPDVGHLAAGAAAAADVPTGRPVAMRLAEARAMLQAGWHALDPARRALGTSLLDRVLRSGTATYELRLDSNPDLDLTARIVTRDGELAQHLAVDPGDGSAVPVQSLYVLADGVTVCTYAAEGTPECGPGADDLRLPFDGIAGLTARPDAVSLTATAPRRVAGEAARCLRVVATPPDGPDEGESCTSDEGVLVYRDNPDQGQRLVLRDRTDRVDESDLVPPSGDDGGDA